MIIFGIDPGIARVGWAVIQDDKGKQKALAYGCITTEQSALPENRLLSIHQMLCNLFKKYSPDCASIEDLFFATNAKTAMSVGQARGVILLTAAACGIPVVSYTPLAVKRTITGNGKAEKMQVQRMVTRILRLSQIPKPDDAADALALALTHAFSYKLRRSLQ
ncbi:crossover junction endodeoxyribonuclease RuvC [Candidatus Gottesmanbacteria bacterium]|nr:crossover junction endodeoxyribonuclease RuvC [Candidatus Gottesmanbacteria bacterium]